MIVTGGRVTVHGTGLPLLSVQPTGGGVGQLDGGPVIVSVQGAGCPFGPEHWKGGRVGQLVGPPGAVTVSVHGAGTPLAPVHWNGGRVEHSDGAGHCEVTVVIDPGPVTVTGTVTVLPEPHSVGWPLLSVQTGGAVMVIVEPGPVGHVPGEVTVTVEPGAPPHAVG